MAEVQRAIDILGYSVNPAARSLASGRTGSVAFVLSERQEHLFEDPNFGLFVRVFSRELRRRGRHLLVTAAEGKDEELFLGDYLTGGHVDGALLTLPHAREPLLERLRASGLPVVVLGEPLGHQEALSWVAIDDEGAAEEIVRYLAAKGRSSIATITGPLNTSSGRRRYEGYRRVVGRRYRKDLVAHGDWSSHSGRAATEQLLARGTTFDALFCASDRMAVGAIAALREAGLGVPDDVAVAGFDDSVAATMVEPALTTVRIPFEESAMEAVRILEGLLDKTITEPRRVLLPSKLVVRDSA